jgi:peptidoglycan/LPS O-acetylase OafA/YrhL
MPESRQRRAPTVTEGTRAGAAPAPEPSASLATLTAAQTVYLDVLRGLAAIAVLMVHLIDASTLPGAGRSGWLGELGVTVFFLLSGFLIGYSVLRRRAGSHALSGFLVDRFSRIYVCFVPAAVAAAIAAALFATPQQLGERSGVGAWQWLGNLLMLQDHPAFQVLRRVGIDRPWFVRPYAFGEPFWTLPIEFFLYVAFGVVAFGFWQRSTRITGGLIALGAFAIVPVLYHSATGWGQCLGLVWLIGAAGALAIDVPARLRARFALSRAHLNRLFAAGLAVVGGMMALRIASRPLAFYELQMAVFLAALGLLGLWLCGSARGAGPSPVARVAAGLAQLGYPLYLTHATVVGIWVARAGRLTGAVDMAQVALLAFANAAVFWFLFDRHYRAVGRWIKARIGAAPAAAAVTAQRAGSGPRPTGSARGAGGLASAGHALERADVVDLEATGKRRAVVGVGDPAGIAAADREIGEQVHVLVDPVAAANEDLPPIVEHGDRLRGPRHPEHAEP